MTDQQSKPESGSFFDKKEPKLFASVANATALAPCVSKKGSTTKALRHEGFHEEIALLPIGRHSDNQKARNNHLKRKLFLPASPSVGNGPTSSWLVLAGQIGVLPLSVRSSTEALLRAFLRVFVPSWFQAFFPTEFHAPAEGWVPQQASQ